MRRRLLIAFIFLLGSAVVNVGVAWGCAMLTTLGVHEHFAMEQHPRGHGVWEVWSRRRSGAVFVRSIPHIIWHGVGGLPESQYRPVDLLPFWFPWHAIDSEQCVDARGWPLVCLWCSYQFSPAHPRVMTLVGGIDPGLRPWKKDGTLVSYPRGLPLRPIWRNFAVNTIFYVAVLWLLFGGPLTLRRLIRVRRGLCPKCAYPIRQSDVCSECGTPVPNRPVV